MKNSIYNLKWALLPIIVTFAILLAVPSPASGEVTWHEWNSTNTSLSNATPAWAKTTQGSGSPSIVDTAGSPTVFKSTASDANAYATMTNTSYWVPTSAAGTTIEFRMKIDSVGSGKDYAAVFSVYGITGDYRFELNLSANGIRFFTGTEYALDTSVFNTYRLTFEGRNAKLYINDNNIPVLTNYTSGGGSGLTRIVIGDIGSSWGGQTEWEYVKWTNDGVFPVPEPSVVALLVPGALALFAARRYFRKK